MKEQKINMKNPRLQRKQRGKKPSQKKREEKTRKRKKDGTRGD
jgi:hypothetical protein